ncbi:protein-disulfide reductase DsbD [Undibacterium umbellatum]|uniref:Thiol:disulfide interchange protein DsbD n=1 Tax=Undibacterium umbellatum TaxID=2762300 RepID=A0ABR6Z726_9BURK|nr:protein-disulfide reductase DsbD [Undibacterium umbellatum]MBC3907573.1 protein-disulfide reductase DsbD [Undibacterium umbellatum]
MNTSTPLFSVSMPAKLQNVRISQLWCLCALLAALLFASLLSSNAKAEDFLDPEEAFKVSARMIEPGMAEVTFTIADGYYLYRERFKFSSDDAKIGDITMPAGKVKFDETFQKEVETYRKSLVVRVPVQAAADFTLNIGRQGCADGGLCYPPLETPVKLQITGANSAGTQTAANASIATANVSTESNGKGAEASTDEETSSISAALKSGRLVLILPLFLLLGLGLSFTPCVLPMVPILSFIIVGEGAGIKRSRGFLLSLCYALGMALVYTALGIAAGLVGEGLSATLQNPWVLGAFALLMVILSLSMFNVYQLQVPAALQTKLTIASEGQRNGKLVGVFFMGAISALIVGPCVAAPLAGALVYISQTRDVVVGGSALFAMAMGMSVPLLLVGISAGSLLPRAGMWMESIKRFFGVLMLAMALWMISPVIPAWSQMLGWAILLLAYAIYQLFFHRSGMFAKAVAVMFSLLGAVQLVGVATGGRDVFSPVAHLYGGSTEHVKFTRVRSIAELDAALAQSKGKTVMLDFYADWCVSCKEMEKLTFPETKVKAKLDNMLLLQVDVTANNADDKALLKRFGLFGPPGIIFFDAQGKEIPRQRVIGYQNADKFLQSLNRAEGK